MVTAGTAIITLLDLTKVYLRGFVPEGQIGEVKVGQPAHVYLDSDPHQPLDAYVSRIDPEATFTPENTYFQSDRVKQVVGIKLQLKAGFGFAKPGMPADGEVLVQGDKWPKAPRTNDLHNSRSRYRCRAGQRRTAGDCRAWPVRNYGPVEAVRGIDFDVRQREIFGLIGPDGAGKTSTFQILAGVMEATSGSANIFGRPAREMRSQTGYLTQAFSLYPDLTVEENIRYCGDLRRIPAQAIVERGNQYLRMFDMDRFADRLAGKLSGGMRQKLSLICALVPQPRVLLLDEPTTGVDPVSRREFWDVLAHLSAEGLTILVATPYLDEAERCHRIAFMHQGQFLRIGTPRELCASLGTQSASNCAHRTCQEPKQFFPD